MDDDKELDGFVEEVRKMGLGGLVGLKKKEGESEEEFNERVLQHTAKHSHPLWYKDPQEDLIEEKCEYLGINRDMYENLSALVKDFQENTDKYSHSFGMTTWRKIEYIKHVLEL